MGHGTLQQIVTELGHLTVFKRTTLLHPFSDGKFYYKDKRRPGEFGPFTSIYEATDHWNDNVVKYIAANKQVELIPEAKLKEESFDQDEAIQTVKNTILERIESMAAKPTGGTVTVGGVKREATPMDLREIHAAGVDYDAHMAGIPVPNNVIEVDFIAKRRIK